MREHRRIGKRLSALSLAFLLLITGILELWVPAEAASGLGTVTLTIERFTLGQGYLVEPVMVEIEEGDDYSTLLTRTMDELGLTYTYTGNIGWSFYLSGIEDADTGVLDIPVCIQTMPPQRNYQGEKVYPPNNSSVNDYAPALKEFSFNNMSGWMYSVNNVFPNVGLDGRTPENGDVFRLQFTVFGYGLDLMGSDVTYHVADKTALTAKIAQINQNKDEWFSIEGCQENYEKAMQVLQTVDATQESVDEITQALPERPPVYPQSITLNHHELELSVNDTASLSAQIEPSDSDDQTLQWSSSAPEVAEVSAAGTVTALSPGKTQITAMTSNGLSDTCLVTVKERKIEEIFLNQSAVFMEAGQTVQLSVTSYKPEDATEKLKLSWSSSDEKVAAVDETGLVTAHEKGEALITAVTTGEVSAQCKVTVGDAKEAAEELEKKIQELPDSASEVTWENAEEIIAIYQEYQSLSEEAKAYLTDASKEKLERLAAAAEKIVEQQGEVQRVSKLIQELPALSSITLEHREQIQQAKSAYDGLSSAQKGRISTSDLQRLNSAVNRLNELLEEIQQVEEAVQAFPAQAGLDDGEKILEAEKAYQALDELQKDSIAQEIKDALETAVSQIVTQIAQAIWKVYPSGALEIESTEVQNFLKADQLYGLLDAQRQAALPEGTDERRLQIEEQIGASIHTDGAMTVDNYWFARTKYEVLEEDQKLLEKISQDQKAEGAESLIHGRVTYEDIRSNQAYQLEKTVKFHLQAPADWDSLKSPVLYRVNAGEITQLDYRYEKETKTLVFESSEVGEFILAKLTVPVTGLTLPVSQKVGKGETVSLEAKILPKNYTQDVRLVWKSKNEKIAAVDQNGTVKGIKEGSTVVTVSVEEDSSIQASCKIEVTSKANSLPKSVETVLEETSAYMLSVDTNPTKGSEWFVVGLARYGLDADSSYFSTYYNHIANYLEEQKGDLGPRYTEYSKLIVTLTAMGKDARKIAGYNLFTYLADFEQVSSQGINGTIWALIALNTNPAYSIPKVSTVPVQTTEQLLIDTILKAEINGGGWSLTGERADSDITGMALQALAPYYQKDGYEDVTAAVDRALNKLSKMQFSSGGYGTVMGAGGSEDAETSESNAQVITALCALGIDPEKDTRFIKNGKWTVENLLTYQVGDTGFMHVKEGAQNNGGAEAGKVNGMATEQAFYALVAYQRLLDGKTSLYDMSDVVLEEGQKGDGTGTGIDNSGGSTGGTGNSQGVSLGTGAETPKSTSGGTTSGGKTYSPTYTGGGTSTGKTASASSGNKKTASSEKKNQTKKGWSFTGETYEGSTSGEKGREETKDKKSENAQSASANSQKMTAEGAGSLGAVWPYMLGGAAGVAVLIICIVLKRKKI